MAKLDILIVDDEPNAVLGLAHILKGHPRVRVVGEATSGREAVQKIDNLKPHVVLLDIQMPGMSGFDVVAEIGTETFPFLVFITAHQEFALQAFEVHAIDYLLKPVDQDRLFSVVDRIREMYVPESIQKNQSRVRSLLNTISAGEDNGLETNSRLAIKSRGSIILVELTEITHIESAGNYVRYFVDGECYLSRSTMNDVERQLNGTSLVRIHRSRIVNVDHIRKLTPDPSGEYEITMQNGIQLTTGHSYRNIIRRIMKSF